MIDLCSWGQSFICPLLPLLLYLCPTAQSHQVGQLHSPWHGAQSGWRGMWPGSCSNSHVERKTIQCDVRFKRTSVQQRLLRSTHYTTRCGVFTGPLVFFFYCRHWLFISVYLSSQIEDHLSTFPKKEIGSDRCSLISLSEMTKALLLPHPPLPSPPPSLSLPLCSALMVFACRPDTTGPLHVSTADIMSFGVSL